MVARITEEERNEIYNYLRQGYSVRKTSKLTGRNYKTVRRYKEKLESQGSKDYSSSFSYVDTVAATSPAPPKPEVNEGLTHYDAKEELLAILNEKKKVPLISICNHLNTSPRNIEDMVTYLSSTGLEIGVVGNDVILSNEPLEQSLDLKPLGDSEIVFGVASDLHFGSTGCQITALNEFTLQCKKEGVTHIFCPGDITAGVGMYKGQEHDQYALTAEDQLSSLLVNLPEGFDWWLLGGNHDYSFISRAKGFNILRSAQTEREDVHYLGFDSATIPVLPGVDMELWHPSGGVAYAISYKLQKGIEQEAYQELFRIAQGKKDRPTLRFLLAGHLHIQLQAMFGPIFGAQCGSFEGETNYLRRKKLYPNVGGYIIKATLDSKGRFKRHEASFLHFVDIEDDYKNYNHARKKDSTPEKPLFT